MRKLAIWIGLLAVLGAANWAIVGKERVLANGQVMLLALAPRDPRSLLQGDYMVLRYAAAERIDLALGDAASASGIAIVSLDTNGVAAFTRLGDADTQLAPHERRLRYRKRGESLRVAGEAFFFEEGQDELYSSAAYGVLMVDERGDAVLVGLADRELNRLDPGNE